MVTPSKPVLGAFIEGNDLADELDDVESNA